MKIERPLLGAGGALAALAVLYGCASFPTMQITPKEDDGHLLADNSNPAGPAPGRTGVDIPRSQTTPATVPGGAGPRAPATPPATPEQIAALIADGPLNATLPPQPLAQYLNTVFREVLHVDYALIGDVGTRQDFISVSASPAISKREYVRNLQATLRNYGLTLAIQGRQIQILEEGASGQSAGRRGGSTIVRSRSSADTPIGAQQVIQYFQLVALQADAVLEFVRGPLLNNTVNVSSDSGANALVLQGSGRQVANAVELLRNLDQPAFAGAQVVALEPIFWPPLDFAQALSQALTAEGYIVSTDPLGPKSIMIVPLPATNRTLVFAADRGTMNRVQYWANELDKPSGVGDQSSTFVYEVRNTGASVIGAMVINSGVGGFGANLGGGLNAAVANALGLPGGPAAQGGRGGGGNAGPNLQNNQGNAGRGGGANNFGGGAGRGGRGAALGGAVQPRAGQVIAGAVPTGGSITVDDSGNRILFTGSASQFAALRSLLTRLDIPSREVVVEVTVAEVTLTDETRSGVEFFTDFLNGAGERFSGGTMGPSSGTPGTLRGPGASGLGRESAGLNLFFDRPYDYQIALNALASNNKVNILSRPRLTARSGAAASIQVGANVPIVIGQRAVNTGATDNSADVTQQIQYQQTGVILNITPVIYGDDRVDLQIYQEVSQDRVNPNPAIQSPIIDKRSVDTILSLADGQTAILGGLIEDSYSKGNKGIPFLKDVPVIGYAFRTDSVSGRKTELVLLITPFIVRNDEDMGSLARQASREINEAFRVGRGSSYTLTPFPGPASLAIYPPNPLIDGAALKRPNADKVVIAPETPPPPPAAPSAPIAAPPPTTPVPRAP